MLAPNPAETAPQDGRVIRGWFIWPAGAQMAAVSWSKDLGGWIDLTGEEVPAGWTLGSWAAE